MDTALLVARILGPIYLLVGIGWMLNRAHYDAMLADFTNSPTAMYLSGILAFGMGILILQFNWIWANDWRVMVSIIGVLGVLEGAILLTFPKILTTIMDALTARPNLMRFMMLLAFALGAAFTWFGYFA